MTSHRLKSRVQRLERRVQTERRGTPADPKLLARFQAALKREAANRGIEASPKREEAA